MTQRTLVARAEYLFSGEEAVLEYRMEGSEVVDMYHTEVPESQRGKGVGGKLAQVSEQQRMAWVLVRRASGMN